MRKRNPVPFEHDPGTPDDYVSPGRLTGREAHREGREPESTAAALRKGFRTDFWLGWYDEELRRFYGR